MKGELKALFPKSFNDWEVEEVESFLVRLSGKRVYGDMEDAVPWVETKRGKFLVKSLYSTLEQVECLAFPSKGIWMHECNLKLVFLLERQHTYQHSFRRHKVHPGSKVSCDLSVRCITRRVLE